MQKRTITVLTVWVGLFLLVGGAVLFLGLRRQKRQVKQMVRLYVYGHGLLELDLEEYLVGVIAAEMPASFHTEALKSQAVAARTYTFKRLSRIQRNGSEYPEGADFTNKPEQGQAWLSYEEMQKKWQSDYQLFKKRIEDAVSKTRGEVLIYGGSLIEALYCSTAGPYTEDAQAVFSNYYPYLKSQANPYDKHSPRYTESKKISITELERSLGINLEIRELILAKDVPQGPKTLLASSVPVAWLNPDKDASILKILSRNRSGRVEQMQIGGKIFRAVDIRTSLGLRSTNFTFEITPDGNHVVFTTLGYGHGVGMSQYGADGMAKEGFNYREILDFYYPGTEVVLAGKIWE